MGPARATVSLELDERARLGLPDSASAIQPGALRPLDEAQWADPEVVAARFALVRANYRAVEDPAGVRARSARYMVPRLQEDLAPSSGGEVAVVELRAQGAAVTGDVVGLLTSERSRDRAVVDVTLRRSVVGDDVLHPEQVVFWRLTLVGGCLTDRWLVANLRLS